MQVVYHTKVNINLLQNAIKLFTEILEKQYDKILDIELSYYKDITSTKPIRQNLTILDQYAFEYKYWYSKYKYNYNIFYKNAIIRQKTSSDSIHPLHTAVLITIKYKIKELCERLKIIGLYDDFTKKYPNYKFDLV